MASIAADIAVRDFGRKALDSLARKGVRVIGMQPIPAAGSMPWANADRGYVVDDNGTGRVLSYGEMRALI